MRVFFHLLDSAVVNVWILYKTVQREKGQWNIAAQQRHTLAWFKECVVLSLCGSYTSRNFTPSESVQVQHTQSNSLEAILKHQVQPIVNIPELIDTPRQGRCCLGKETKRTACIVCLQVLRLWEDTFETNPITVLQKVHSSNGRTINHYNIINHRFYSLHAPVYTKHWHWYWGRYWQWYWWWTTCIRGSTNYSHIHTLASSAYHKNPYNGYSQGTDTR